MDRIFLQREATRLKVVHRQRVQRQGDADPAPAFSAAELPASVVSAAAAGWQRLLETEYESVVIAGWMTSALARLGAPLDVIGAFGRVVEDEIRHVDICAQMVERFGGRPSVPRAAVPPVPLQLEPGTEGEFEVLSGLVSFFCVFEHLSGLVFRQALGAAQVGLARWALSEIFRDEAFHGAFGYEAAKLYVPSWDEARRARLGQRVVADVRRFEQRLGGPLPAEAEARPPDPEAEALERLGLLSTPALLGTFYAGVQQQLLPRMAELGVPLDLRVERRA
ncbi:MAG: ferritin-like domain-containing protein [Myxococcales bacterium]|nr:ferritin-like domain-containing protein [Myxococcota bacterium]MDW8282451.1 ferritin-like domain-containing protein [Myxococcales bacterium]